jgi:hypothetical protein
VQFCQDAIGSEWSVRYKLVPDEQHLIEEAIKSQVSFLSCMISFCWLWKD